MIFHFSEVANVIYMWFLHVVGLILCVLSTCDWYQYEKVNDATRTTKDVIPLDSILGKTEKIAFGNGNSAPDADNHEDSPEKNDSKNASNIANEQKKVPRQRKKNC